MTIERLMETDLAHINELKPEEWNDLVPYHTLYLRNSFCHPMKVMDGETCIGIGTAICFGETGWLSHIIVRKAYRSRGIGRFLVTSLISFLSKVQGCRSISLIASDMGYPLYATLGFSTQTEYVSLSRAGTASAAPGEEKILSGSVSPLEEKHVAHVLNIDRSVSGEKRSRILRQFTRGAFVYSRDDSGDGGTIDGAYFPSLGDGLIIAEEETAGIALMRRCLLEKGKITIPIENEAARTFLEQHGCIETRRMKRMLWGEPFAWDPKELFNRIGGFLG